MSGRFITFEGGEGVGKTTQLKQTADWLRASGIESIVTREPGGTPQAEALRQILLTRDGETMPASAELLLMFAARALHLENLVCPALDRGAWVLCDRFTDATYAYQGGGRGMETRDIDALVRVVHPRRQPDLTLLLDAPVEVGLGRALERSGSSGRDRFETEQRDFFERVRSAYLERARREPQRIRVIDASGDRTEVFKAIQQAVAPLLDRSKGIPEPG
jgi:dTMP kinase